MRWAGRGRSRRAAGSRPGRPPAGSGENGDRSSDRLAGWSSVAPAGQADPEGDGGGGDPDVLGEVEAERGEPGAADRCIQSAAVLGDPKGPGHGDGADRVRAG